jgi:hypothetical protein
MTFQIATTCWMFYGTGRRNEFSITLPRPVKTIYSSNMIVRSFIASRHIPLVSLHAEYLLVHSYLSATNGSRRDARRAGMKHARMPTNKAKQAIAANVRGSVVETPQI